MAEAVQETRTRLVTTEVTEEVVRLTLTLPEALVLRRLLRKVGGDRNDTYRAYTHGIDAALSSAGALGGATDDYFSGYLYGMPIAVGDEL